MNCFKRCESKKLLNKAFQKNLFNFNFKIKKQFYRNA